MPLTTTITPPPPSGLPPIRIEQDAGGTSVSFSAEGPSGDGHFLKIVFGGGHWEIHLLGALPINTGLEVGEDGYAVVHKV